MKNVVQVFFLLFGVTGIILFHLGIYFPIYISIFGFLCAIGCLIWAYYKKRVGDITIFLFLVYSLPFIHIIPYLWYDFEVKGLLLFWKLTLNPYMTVKRIIELMSMIGAIGALGFATGALLVKGKLNESGSSDQGKTLSLPVFFVWTVLAIGFTWISAPQEIIFIAAYTHSNPLNQNWNFASAWMVSYVFLLFPLADSIFEKQIILKRIKQKMIIFTFLVIVIWFQLLRGDRESITCIFAALLMYFVWGKEFLGTKLIKKKINRVGIIVGGFVIFVVAYFIGVIRTASVGICGFADLSKRLSDPSFSCQFQFDNIFHGTWSASLLSPISIAGDYINGKLPINYGQTYLDLLASIIPGFLADLIGYTRPINGLQGPAWEMTYGIGGTHAVVVPFMNFRMGGVFVIIAFWSFILAKIERYALKHITVSKLALLGTIAMAAPHWLWYGEKYIMNAVIIWFILSILYRLRWGSDNINFTG